MSKKNIILGIASVIGCVFFWTAYIYVWERSTIGTMIFIPFAVACLFPTAWLLFLCYKWMFGTMKDSMGKNQLYAEAAERQQLVNLKRQGSCYASIPIDDIERKRKDKIERKLKSVFMDRIVVTMTDRNRMPPDSTMIGEIECEWENDNRAVLSMHLGKTASSVVIYFKRLEKELKHRATKKLMKSLFPEVDPRGKSLDAFVAACKDYTIERYGEEDGIERWKDIEKEISSIETDTAYSAMMVANIEKNNINCRINYICSSPILTEDIDDDESGTSDDGSSSNLDGD